MTLKELKARFDATVKARKEKADEIERLKAKREEVSSKMLSAADRGDLDEYKDLSEQLHDIEARIFVFSRSLPSAGNPLTHEEIISAWDSFTKTYNKDIKKQYEEYLADCSALAMKFKRLVNIQNAALYEREKALQIMGESRTSDALKMYMIPAAPESSELAELSYRWRRSTTINELPFFVGIGAITQKEAEMIDSIIEGGQPAQD